MNASTATLADTQALRRFEKDAPYTPDGGIRLNGHVVIFSVVTLLTLVTAGECHSVTHLRIPSLLYGAVLWGWWGCVACILWKIGVDLDRYLELC